MAGINKVILIGNVGNDIELKTLSSGDSVTDLSIATSDSWVDKNTGERQEKTEWHRVVLFRKTAEIAAQYLSKGSKVYIEGTLRTRKWVDNNNQTRYTTEIIAREIQFLDRRGPSTPAGETVPTNATQSTSQKQAIESPATDDLDDDIPF